MKNVSNQRRSQYLTLLMTVIASVVTTYACMFIFGISARSIDTRRLLVLDKNDNTLVVISDFGIRLGQPIRVGGYAGDSFLISFPSDPNGVLRLTTMSQSGAIYMSAELAVSEGVIRVLDGQEQEVWRSR